MKVQTIQNVDSDACDVSIGRTAGIFSRIREVGVLDKQDAGGDIPLFGDHTDTPATRIVANNLKINFLANVPEITTEQNKLQASGR